MMSAPNACGKCCRNCLKMHRKHQSDSSIHSSFFKIMFGDKFDEYLNLPPAFAKNFQAQANTRITLQDSNRRNWDVLLTKVNDSLAFEKGWHNFVLDHNLVMGDLVVFDYFKGGQFFVDIFGKSGCPKKFTGISESYRSSIPTKRSSDSSYKQPGQKMPKNVRIVKDPSIVARNAPSKVVPVAKTHVEPRSVASPEKSRPNVVPLVPSRGKSRPDVVPMPETFAESCFMTNRGKSRPNVVPVPETSAEPCFMSSRKNVIPNVVSETFVEPCFTSNRDESRPKRVSVSEALVEPCFMTSREKNVTAEYDRELLFDLSAFEIPKKKPLKKDTDSLRDFSPYDLPAVDTDAYTTGELHPQGNIFSQLSDTSQNAALEMPDRETIFAQDHVGDYVVHMPVPEMPENDKGQPHGNLHSKVSGKYQNSETEAASVSLKRCKVSEKKGVLSESHQAALPKREFAPLSSSLPDVASPVDSITPLKIIGTPETQDFSAFSDRKLRLNNQKKRMCKQEVYADAGGSCSLGTSLSISEPNHGNLAESSIHTANVGGGNMKLVKKEFRNVEEDIRGGEMVDGCSGGDFSISEPIVKVKDNVTIVKVEPVVCDAPSATVVKFGCLVPPHTDFLELPRPLAVVERVLRRNKQKNRLVFLRDYVGRLWPVVYHNNNGLKVLTTGWKTFMRANNIESGDECIFTVENSKDCRFIVQVVPHQVLMSA